MKLKSLKNFASEIFWRALATLHYTEILATVFTGSVTYLPLFNRSDAQHCHYSFVTKSEF